MAYMNAYNDDFASFLHNPYGFLNKKQTAAVNVFKRKGKFVGGYCAYSHLKEIISMFFGNSSILIKNGLTYHYNQLKKYVEDNNLIGLILYGADINNIGNKEQFISTYINLKNEKINLEITTICQVLLKNYFNDDEKYIDSLCEKTPNFNLYYESSK